MPPAPDPSRPNDDDSARPGSAGTVEAPPTDGKSLPALAVPLVISFTTRFLFSLVDMVFATTIGTAAVAAIAFYAPFQAFYIALWVGLSGGFTASLSAAFGHRDEARVRSLQRGMLRILLTVIPILVAIGGLHWFVIPAYRLEPEMEGHFRVYCTTLLCGMALTGFWAMIPDSIVKAHHDTRATMIAGLIASFTNVALNVVFLFVFDLGLFGIALATVVSRLTSLAYAWRRAAQLEAGRREKAWTPIARGEWGPPIRSILVLAVPGALTFSLTGVESMFVNTVLNALPDATASIAAWGIFDRALQLALMPAAGCAVAVVPFAARLLPQGGHDRVRRDLISTAAGLAAFGVLTGLAAGWVWPGAIAEFFLKGDGDIPPAALTALGLLPLAVLGAIPFYLLRPLFEAAQQPRIGVLLSVLRFVVLSAPAIGVGYFVAQRSASSGLVPAVTAIVASTALASCVAIVLARRLLRSGP